MRRRQRHDRPDGRVLGIGGVVVVLEEDVDDDSALRVGDQVDLAARVLALGPLELLGEAEAGSLQVAVRLVGAVRTTVGRVREVRDLVVAVAEGAGVEAERRVVRRAGGVDAADGHEEVAGSSGAVGGRAAVRALLAVMPPVGGTGGDVDRHRREDPGRRMPERRARNARQPPRATGADAGERASAARRRSDRAAHGVPTAAPGVDRRPGGIAERAGEIAGDRCDARPSRGERPGDHSPGVPRLGRHLVGRDEPDQLREIAHAEQALRVEIAVAEADAEVEPAGLVLGAGAAGGADDLAARDAIAGAHADAGEERVRRAEIAVVGDDDVQGAGDRAGERDHAVAGRPHGRPRRHREVDAAMTGAVRERRRLEGPRDRPVDGRQPHAAAAGWRRCGAGPARVTRDEERAKRRDRREGRPSPRGAAVGGAWALPWVEHDTARGSAGEGVTERSST